MDGVRILAENTSQLHWWTVLIVALCIGAMGFLVVYFYSSNIVCGIIYGVIILIVLFLAIYIPNRKTKVTYDVIIDETVSWQKFNDKYEVVSQRGDIITVKLKSEK